MEAEKALILRFERGQFTFRSFNHESTDEEMFNLAHDLNAFQEDGLARVIKVQVTRF